MAEQAVALYAFNRGVIDPRALCRIDLEKTALAAEVQLNWIPRILGSMMLRPGLEYITQTLNNNRAVYLPFIFSNDDTALLELTNQKMRVLVDEDPIARVAVSTTLANGNLDTYVTNGTFDTDTAWTKGAGWAIAAGVAAATLASSALSQNAAVAIVAGASYSITYTITRSAGSVTPSIGGTNGVTRSAAGTYTETIVAGATQVLAFTGAGFTGSVDNFSMDAVTATAGWVDADEVGGVSVLGGGGLFMQGTRFAAAVRRQQVTVAGADQNKEHGLRIVVTRGPVTLRVGSTSGADDYISETSLGTGVHSLAFTPTGATVFVQFSVLSQSQKIIDSVQIEGAGVIEIDTPWVEADLRTIRWDQSADVLFLACKGYQQRRIERRSDTSWSVILYEANDGPFRLQNTGATRLTPSARTGDITLTADRSLFKTTNVGSLFKLSSTGQVVDATLTGDNQFTNEIRVTGTGTQRAITLTITGTWSATITLQRSVSEPGAWVDVATYTTNQAGITYNDALDNQIIYYRIGIKTSGYTSGTAQAQLAYTSGTLTGIVRITAYTSATSVSAAVVQDLGGTTATTDWWEGEWSDRRGFPTSVTLHEGRLWWVGKGKIWGSVSDAYQSFDEETEGDSGPINRSIGSGPVDSILWCLPLQRLILGAEGAEWSARSSGLDEPLTPSNFNLKAPSTQGSANVNAAKVDDRGLYVQKSGKKLFQLSSEGDVNYEYSSIDMTRFCPQIGKTGIVRIAVQRQPDTRVHCVLADGTVALLVSQPVDDVVCWVPVETRGNGVEDVVILPGIEEDKVYYEVKRSVNGQDVRNLERWAMETECVGGLVNKQADSFLTYDGAATNTINVPHLKGEQVIIWADGKDYSPYDAPTKTQTTFTVNAGTGNVSLPGGATAAKWVVGLPYQARFKSTKLAYAAQNGSALTKKKGIDHLGLVLADTHKKGLYYGLDFDTMFDLPNIERGKVTDPDQVWEAYDEEGFAFPAGWDSDSRICLMAMAPRPACVLGAVIDMSTHG